MDAADTLAHAALVVVREHLFQTEVLLVVHVPVGAGTVAGGAVCW